MNFFFSFFFLKRGNRLTFSKKLSFLFYFKNFFQKNSLFFPCLERDILPFSKRKKKVYNHFFFFFLSFQTTVIFFFFFMFYSGKLLLRQPRWPPIYSTSSPAKFFFPSSSPNNLVFFFLRIFFLPFQFSLRLLHTCLQTETKMVNN